MLSLELVVFTRCVLVLAGKPIEQLETELLDGQKLQGPPTARELFTVLHNSGIDKHYPIFSAVHKILAGEMPATHLVDALKNHPEHFPHHPPYYVASLILRISFLSFASVNYAYSKT